MMLATLLLTAAVLPAPQEGAARAGQAVEAAGSPESHIEAGLKEFKRRRFARAQEHFEQALQASPEDRRRDVLPGLHRVQDRRAEAAVPSRQAEGRRAVREGVFARPDVQAGLAPVGRQK